MASASVAGIHGWGNLYHPSLPGALGLSPWYDGGGLRALFLFGQGVASSENQVRFVLTIEAYLHHTRAPPRTSNSTNLKRTSTT